MAHAVGGQCAGQESESGAGAPGAGLFCGSDLVIWSGFCPLFFGGVEERKEKWLQHLTKAKHPSIVGGCRPKATLCC